MKWNYAMNLFQNERMFEYPIKKMLSKWNHWRMSKERLTEIKVAFTNFSINGNTKK
jgi:hypothetical protein